MFPELFLGLILIFSLINAKNFFHLKVIIPDYIKGLHPIIVYCIIIVVLCIISFIVPIQEEFIFRFLLTRVLCHYSYYQYIISFIFALSHLTNYSSLINYYSSSSIIYPLISQVFITFFMGLCLQGTLQPDPETCLITLSELSYTTFLHGTFNFLAGFCALILNWNIVTSFCERLPDPATDLSFVRGGSYICRHPRDDGLYQCKKCHPKYRQTKDPILEKLFIQFHRMIYERGSRQIKISKKLD